MVKKPYFCKYCLSTNSDLRFFHEWLKYDGGLGSDLFHDLSFIPHQSSWNFLLFLQTKFVVVKFFLIISSFNLFWWLVICMGVTCHSYSTFKSYSCQNPNHNVGWGLTQLSLHTRTLLLPERMILGVWNFVLGALNLELPTKIIQSIFFDNVVRTPTTMSTQTNLTSKSWVRSENDFHSLCCCCS